MTIREKIANIIKRVRDYAQVKDYLFIADKILLALEEKQPTHKCWVNKVDPTNMGFCAICGKTPSEEKQEGCNHTFANNFCIKCQQIILQPLPTRQIEKLDYDNLDIARIDPEKRQFVQAIQLAINQLRKKVDEHTDRLNSLGEK